MAGSIRRKRPTRVTCAAILWSGPVPLTDAAAGRPFGAIPIPGRPYGLQLLLDHPDRVTAATLVCTGARIGDATSWSTRVESSAPTRPVGIAV